MDAAQRSEDVAARARRRPSRLRLLVLLSACLLGCSERRERAEHGLPIEPTSPTDDVDADGVLTRVDNCAVNPNPLQADADGDGVGDACSSGDFDGDGVEDRDDSCVALPNPAQLNADGDARGDACDSCPSLPDTPSTGTDADFVPQPDDDADGVGDACDNCPTAPNADQSDADSDDAGDACDP